MASMVISDMRAIGQFGSTVCVGLLLDTLIVRTLLMPSIATLLGRWFWWPQVVHPRGDRKMGRIHQPTDDTVTTQPLGVGSLSPQASQ
jgi:putative drug exporter of the RND superfamily